MSFDFLFDEITPTETTNSNGISEKKIKMEQLDCFTKSSNSDFTLELAKFLIHRSDYNSLLFIISVLDYRKNPKESKLDFIYGKFIVGSSQVNLSNDVSFKIINRLKGRYIIQNKKRSILSFMDASPDIFDEAALFIYSALKKDQASAFKSTLEQSTFFNSSKFKKKPNSTLTAKRGNFHSYLNIIKAMEEFKIIFPLCLKKISITDFVFTEENITSTPEYDEFYATADIQKWKDGGGMERETDFLNNYPTTRRRR